ncbi:Spondin-2 [Melipona quadrifasciata]|uniref:Spondin-2 n=1 Tax=Melipona quadrifasciata TaxID=166423 RepID=A0A0M8ZQE7_9HYME|nr:Spondin-2 [Melipona quadrifasciata]
MDADGDSPNSLHSFTGPQVPQGEGTSIARAFLDGNHTLISIMARINPSPDWFVGVDSFQLCVEGNWVDTVTVEVIIVDERSLISIHTHAYTHAHSSSPARPRNVRVLDWLSPQPTVS